jgi:hypothetical protein
MTLPPVWIFQAVPKTYDLALALRDKDEDVWIAKQGWQHMAPGQVIYFWLGAPIGGLVATGRIVAAVFVEPPPPDQASYWRANAGQRKSEPLRRVTVAYERKFPLAPITRAALQVFPELARQPPIGSFFAATNFRLTDAAADRLAAIVSRHKA